MRHTPEKLDKIIEAVRQHNSPEPARASLIERLLVLGLPYLDAEAANVEIVRLNLENMVLQAQLDAMKWSKSK